MNNERESIKNMNYKDINEAEIKNFEAEIVSNEILKKIKDRFSVRIFEEDKNIIDLQNKSLGDLINSPNSLKLEFENIKNDYEKMLTKDEKILHSFDSFSPFSAAGLHSYDASQHHKIITTDKSISIIGFNYINKPLTAAKYSFQELKLVHLDHYSKDSYNLTIYTLSGAYYFLTCSSEEFKAFLAIMKKSGVQTEINEAYKLRVFLYWLVVCEFFLYIPVRISENVYFGLTLVGMIVISIVLLWKTHKNLRKNLANK